MGIRLGAAIVTVINADPRRENAPAYIASCIDDPTSNMVAADLRRLRFDSHLRKQTARTSIELMLSELWSQNDDRYGS